MTKYKLISKASTSGYKKIYDDRTDIQGFPEIGLLPVYHDGDLIIPTGYVRYRKQDEKGVKK